MDPQEFRLWSKNEDPYDKHADITLIHQRFCILLLKIFNTSEFLLRPYSV